MPQGIKQRALTLAGHGLPVFPIKPGRKMPPLIKSWQQNASTDPKQVAAWWAQYPKANIGVHCRDLLVVDIDTKKGGMESLKAALTEHGKLPATFAVSTPSGGQHLYYRAPGGVKNKVDLFPGVDIRTNNGYVLAPGSQVDGKPYAILRKGAIADAPEWLVAACTAAEPEIQHTPAPSDVDPGIAAQRAREWLLRADPAVEGRGGDHHTFKIVCRVRDFGVPEAMALEVLEEWNASCSPPWAASDLEEKIHNAYRYAQNAPGTQSVEAMFDAVEASEEAPEISDKPAPVSEAAYSPDSVTLADVLATNYLVKGWLEQGSHGMLFGAFGAGKTFVALDLAAHLCAGRSWFGGRVTQGGVLYLGYEGFRALRRRVFALRDAHKDWDLSTLQILSMRWPLAARDTHGHAHKALFEALKAYHAAHRGYPGLIIVDPLRNALGGSDSDPELTAPYLSYMQRVIDKTGATVLTVHHPGHSDHDRGRGDSALEAHMDTVLRLDPGRGSLEAKKQRDEATREAFYRLERVELGKDSDGDPVTTCIVQQVDGNPLDPALTNTQRETLKALRTLVGPEGEVTRTLFNSVCSEIGPRAKAEAWEVLKQKGYLVKDGKAWRFGAGAAEMFDLQPG